ncbi:MAG: F420-0:Gamma-glutamyl ligase [Gloeomargaritaceae cyanobacterium C42_A2020_066]|nr:F420-0:Gamma-glutamyl ligase [Gloeomargaritaceae cyanobacterium C42_A2020_066]
MGWPEVLSWVGGGTGLTLGLLEVLYRRQPGNSTLTLSRGTWQRLVQLPQHCRWQGRLEFHNPSGRLEVMVPQVWAEVQLLSRGSVAEIETHLTVTPQHSDAPARADGYWFAYILKRRHRTRLQVTLDIKGRSLADLQVAWVQIHYIAYGPGGRQQRSQHVVLPLTYPEPDPHPQPRTTAVAQCFPVRTHLLCHLDDPAEVVRRYVLPMAQPGDIITLGETPVAIMQGRWLFPGNLEPGWLARRLCYGFTPTSSLATACGLQTLINSVGPGRVLFAFLVGVLGKLVGIRGLFYRLAGAQAALIDDVTGTLPPYDQFIVLGPADPQGVVDHIRAETGLEAAIVDVNDLKAVKIVAATSGIAPPLLIQALRDNPAGNADEQTPLVLIRPRTPGHP